MPGTMMRRRKFVNWSIGITGLLPVIGLSVYGHDARDKSGMVSSGERISEEDIQYLRRSIELSDSAPTEEYGNNYPFGSVLVLGNGAVFEGWNHVKSNNNPVHHGELWLISHTIERLGLDWQGEDAPLLQNAALYTSTEPCAMCAGAIYWAGITRVVFACSLKSLTGIFEKLYPQSSDHGLPIASREVLDPSGRETCIIGPLLEEQALEVHRRHWPGLIGIQSPFA